MSEATTAAFRPHQAVKFKRGKLANLVGTVREISPRMVLVDVAGVRCGVPFESSRWVNPSLLEIVG